MSKYPLNCGFLAPFFLILLGVMSNVPPRWPFPWSIFSILAYYGYFGLFLGIYHIFQKCSHMLPQKGYSSEVESLVNFWVNIEKKMTSNQQKNTLLTIPFSLARAVHVTYNFILPHAILVPFNKIGFSSKCLSDQKHFHPFRKIGKFCSFYNKSSKSQQKSGIFTYVTPINGNVSAHWNIFGKNLL